VPYEERFQLVEDYLDQTNDFINTIEDDFVKTRFTGFLAVNAVTVFELCIKDILIEFSEKKHNVFGVYTSNQLKRINGRIKISDINELVKKFGDKYSKRFERNINITENNENQFSGKSVTSSYGNLIVWRHKFAHEGEIPNNATYTEAKNSYYLGKKVIHVLSDSMVR